MGTQNREKRMAAIYKRRGRTPIKPKLETVYVEYQTISQGGVTHKHYKPILKMKINA